MDHVIRLYEWAEDFDLPYSRALDLAILCHDVIWDENPDKEMRSIHWMMEQLVDGDPDAYRASRYIETTIDHDIDEGCELIFLDLADFSRPEFASDLSKLVVLEYSIFYSRSASDSIKGCADYLRHLYKILELPETATLPVGFPARLDMIKSGVTHCARKLENLICPPPTSPELEF
jgi:hypothetical protein